MTRVRGCEEFCIAASPSSEDHLSNFGRMRSRTISSCSARSYSGADSITSDDSHRSSHDDLTPPDSAEIIFGILMRILYIMENRCIICIYADIYSCYN